MPKTRSPPAKRRRVGDSPPSEHEEEEEEEEEDQESEEEEQTEQPSTDISSSKVARDFSNIKPEHWSLFTNTNYGAFGLAINKGRVAVVCDETSTIYLYNQKGKLIKSLDESTSDDLDIGTPTAISFAGDDILVIADDIQCQLIALTVKGKMIGCTHEKLDHSPTQQPYTVFADLERSRLITTNSHDAKVLIFSLPPEFKLIHSFGSKEAGVSQLVEPEKLSVNSKGSILIGDKDGYVKAFDKTGQFEFKFKATAPSSIGGISVDSHDHIAVTDTTDHCIHFFTPDGVVLGSYGSQGQAIGQLSRPTDVKFDQTDRCFVSDFGNSRIQIITAPLLSDKQQ